MAQPLQVGVQMYTLRSLHERYDNQSMATGAFGAALTSLDGLCNRIEVCAGLMPTGLGSYDTNGAKALNGILTASNQEVIGVHTSMEELEKTENFKKMVDWSKAIGTDHLVHAYGDAEKHFGAVKGTNQANPETAKAYVQRQIEMGQKLREEGLNWSYHNHHMEFYILVGDVPFCIYLLEESNPTKVGGDYLFIELDALWTKAGGHDPEKVMKDYPGRFIVLHAKDGIFSGEGWGLQKRFTAVGEGDIEFEPIISQAKADPRLLNVVYEQDLHGIDEKGDKIEDSPESWSPMRNTVVSLVNLTELLK